MLPPEFLVPILPPDYRGLPAPGTRIRWPGEDWEWMFDGERWVRLRLAFDGGDAWEALEELERGDAAA